MDLETLNKINAPRGDRTSKRDLYVASKVLLVLISLVLLSSFFVIVNQADLATQFPAAPLD